MLLIYEATLSDPYSAATQFGGVTDWYQEPSHDSRKGIRRQAPLAHECTYTNFMKFKPLHFKGIEGVVELTQWSERVETVFHTSNYTVENQIKFATCTLLGSAQTGEIKKLEVEMWNLKVKGTDVTENKRNQDDKQQQQQNKRQNTSRAYTAGHREKKPYGGSKSLFSKCKYHHDGRFTPKCHKCNRVGHLDYDCRSPAATNNQRKLTCYECGNQGHYMSDCLELKNQNHRNQAGGTRACRMVHALGGGETNQDLNNMEDDINS
nr:hypothetical protein [Tanacetum cinerariifolium]